MALIEPKNGVPASPEPGSGDDAPLRVILVGRTGLDAGLRLDPAVELVRVRTRLEAIGELSEPAGGRPPRRSVVVVGTELPGAGAIVARPGEFVGALRRVDPRVRVVAAGAEAADEIGECDAVVRPDAAADAIRIAVRGQEPPRGGADIAGVADAGAPAEPAAAPAGDHEIISALLQGRDPLRPALAELRRRLGGRPVEFTPTAARGAEEAPVVWRGRTLGALRGAPRQELERYAEWLAAWIALRDQQAQLREAAFTDPLTGAYNRRFFERFLASAIEGARRHRRTVTVLVFDVDDFKGFNDRHGHAAGDDILRETVRLLRSVIRPEDKVCRIGGDEFAVIFHEPEGPRTPTSKPPADIFAIARRFQREVCSARFPKLGQDAPGALTISGGLATYPWDGQSPEELLRRADELALDSKRQGKNAIRFGPYSEQLCPELPPR